MGTPDTPTGPKKSSKRGLRRRHGVPHESTIRAELFSDGVFAVAITLLALDLLRIRATPTEDFATVLRENWTTLLAFAASFAAIGVGWLNHHTVFSYLARTSRAVNGANLLMLS